MVRVMRGELARLAVVQERLRLGRYLHHLLGGNLAAIALQCDRTYRLLPIAPHWAKQEMGKVLLIARQLLTDVRAIARDFRTTSLAAEADTAVATLAAAGIPTKVSLPQLAVATEAETVLALVLRETASAVAQAGTANEFNIEATETGDLVRLRVTIDAGAGTELPFLSGTDHASERLRGRLETVGARLWAETDDSGRLELVVDAPADGLPISTVRPARASPLRRMRVPAVVRGSPNAALAVTMGMLLCYNLVLAVQVITEGMTGLALAGFTACSAAILVLQGLHCSDAPRHWSRRLRSTTLTLQALATYLPLLWVGGRWAGMAGFLAGSVLLVGRGPARWILYPAVVASVPILLLTVGTGLVRYQVSGVLPLLAVLLVYWSGSVPAIVREVRALRRSHARMAVLRERLRVAQDLHDLLGYCLSVITLKSELTYRLLPAAPDRAREVLAEVLGTARQALVDLQGTTSGSLAMSLGVEVDSALSTLSSVDIEATLTVATGDLPRRVETVLAIALREAVTNVLRHGKAQHCVIEITRPGPVARLHVANDGIDITVGALAADGGMGLDNLQARLEAIGGSFAAHRDDTGWFHVTAEAPVQS